MLGHVLSSGCACSNRPGLGGGGFGTELAFATGIAAGAGFGFAEYVEAVIWMQTLTRSGTTKTTLSSSFLTRSRSRVVALMGNVAHHITAACYHALPRKVTLKGSPMTRKTPLRLVVVCLTFVSIAFQSV